MVVERTMPAGQRVMTMKLFGTVLLSLAFFSFCSGDDEGTSSSNATTLESLGSVPSPKPTGNISITEAENITKPKDNITSYTSTSPANTTIIQPTSQSTTNTAGWSTSSTQNTTAKAQCNSTQTITDHSDKTSASPDIQNNATDAPQKTTETTATNITGQGKERDISSSDNAANTGQGEKEDSSYKDIILPVIITLIVISLVVFLLMALYKICLKTTPERQENGTEQAPSDKENVKLISVKTTSSETGMSSFLTLSSYDLPLDMSLPLESFKPMRASFSREE